MTAFDAAALADRMECHLTEYGHPDRAVGEKRYLKSVLGHLGVRVPVVRRSVQTVRREHPNLEFFVRKAIGWMLREISRHRPGYVRDWVASRTDRVSGVTIREAVRHLPDHDRERLLAAYRRGSVTL